MFKQPPDPVPGKLDDGFNIPVESIMMCEEFKSNFARRLSNRYKSNLVMSSRQDNTLKLRPVDICLQDYVPETVERSPQPSKTVEKTGIQRKARDKNVDIRSTEISALNMKVETLRWQLAQTEANRQMHIALLKQIVSFLSRVKEHIECQTPDSKDRSKLNNLPRSPSVAHVNKDYDIPHSPMKKVNARKISKSVSNVNGYNDCSVWSQPKLHSIPETDASQKIKDEITRLITLASSVLSIKLPDLTCNFTETTTNKPESAKENEQTDLDNTLIPSDDSENKDKFDVNKLVKDFIPLNCGLEKKLDTIKVEQKPKMETKPGADKDFAAYIEDESGFSSMSSFQEIGIPIISITPPPQSKEVGYMEEINGLFNETEKWKHETNVVDKSVKVFWV